MIKKPFDLDKARAGHPLVARNGSLGKFIAYIPECKQGYRVLALIAGHDEPTMHYDDGSVWGEEGNPSEHDLFLLGRTREGWININQVHNDPSEHLHATGVYASQEAANKAENNNRIACVRVEWEE